MSVFGHIILLIGNIIISTFAAIMVPDIYPEISGIGSVVLGGGLFLLGLQIHVIFLIVIVNLSIVLKEYKANIGKQTN